MRLGAGGEEADELYPYALHIRQAELLSWVSRREVSCAALGSSCSVRSVTAEIAGAVAWSVSGAAGRTVGGVIDLKEEQ